MEESIINQIIGPFFENFKESILIDVRAEFKSQALNLQPIIPPEYLTRQEVAEILKVSLVTLSAWNSKKILIPYRLGNLIRYKRSEIDQALIRINNKEL